MLFSQIWRAKALYRKGGTNVFCSKMLYLIVEYTCIAFLNHYTVYQKFCKVIYFRWVFLMVTPVLNACALMRPLVVPMRRANERMTTQDNNWEKGTACCYCKTGSAWTKSFIEGTPGILKVSCRFKNIQMNF